MDIKELAEFLGMSPNYVRLMASAGRIPAEAIVRPPGTRKWRFIPSKIQEWAKYQPPRRRRVRI